MPFLDRAVKAGIHVDDTGKFYSDDVKKVTSVVYGPEKLNARENPTGYKPIVLLWAVDTVTALERIKATSSKQHVCVLNFASYKNPGGGYLKGYKAQEEDLCAQSILYNVLSNEEDYYKWNNKNLNKGLYKNRAIYSKNVLFFDKKDKPTMWSDVLTCASPNWKAAEKNGVSKIGNTEALEQRITFIKDIVKLESPDVFIAGAFGCGVFGQDPKEVAYIFKKAFNEVFNNHLLVIFAIPGGYNYEIFKKTFR